MTIDPTPETDARPASGGEDVTDDPKLADLPPPPDDATAAPGNGSEATAPPFDAESQAAPTVDEAGDATPTIEAPAASETPAATTETIPAVPADVDPEAAALVVTAADLDDEDDEDEPPAVVDPAAALGRRRRPKRIKARQVQRVVTRVDPWSMLKVSLLFALSMWLIVVVAGVIIWRVAVSTGTISNFENFLAQTLGEDTFTIDGGQIFQGSIVIGLVFFVTGAVFAVVTSVLFNLISGVVGGVRFTMVELETARPADDPAENPQP